MYRKIARKNSEWPKLAVPNLEWLKMAVPIFPKKTGINLEWPKKAIFSHSEFIQVFLGKIVRKNLEQPFLAIPNLYQTFWEKLSEKFGMAFFGHSKFIPDFLGKIVRKIRNGLFWPF